LHRIDSVHDLSHGFIVQTDDLHGAADTGATVQSDVVDLVDGALSVEVDLPQPVARRNSMMFFSHGTSDPANLGHIFAHFGIRGRMISDQRLSFDRDGTGYTFSIAWFTTELTDNDCTLVLTRGSSLQNADASWTVVWLR